MAVQKIDLGSIIGPQGPAGKAADNYAFTVENGELFVSYEDQESAPEFALTTDGHLTKTVNGATVDLGNVKGPKGDPGDGGSGSSISCLIQYEAIPSEPFYTSVINLRIRFDNYDSTLFPNGYAVDVRGIDNWGDNVTYSGESVNSSDSNLILLQNSSDQNAVVDYSKFDYIPKTLQLTVFGIETNNQIDITKPLGAISIPTYQTFGKFQIINYDFKFESVANNVTNIAEQLKNNHNFQVSLVSSNSVVESDILRTDMIFPVSGSIQLKSGTNVETRKLPLYIQVNGINFGSDNKLTTTIDVYPFRDIDISSYTFGVSECEYWITINVMRIVGCNI